MSTVEHNPLTPAPKFPDPNWTVSHSGKVVAHCHSEGDARRVADGLDLLDEDSSPVWTAVHLPESEILTRAREAAIAVMPQWGENEADQARRGNYDHGVSAVMAAARALRDLAKPLEEIVPKADADEAEAGRLAAEEGWAFARDAVLLGIRRGRELERAAGYQSVKGGTNEHRTIFER